MAGSYRHTASIFACCRCSDNADEEACGEAAITLASRGAARANEERPVMCRCPACIASCIRPRESPRGVASLVTVGYLFSSGCLCRLCTPCRVLSCAALCCPLCACACAFTCTCQCMYIYIHQDLQVPTGSRAGGDGGSGGEPIDWVVLEPSIGWCSATASTIEQSIPWPFRLFFRQHFCLRRRRPASTSRRPKKCREGASC